MNNMYYIGADVHSNYTELAIEKNCQIVSRYSVPTTITAISQVLTTIGGQKYFAIEEGPMAGWLYRNLKDSVEDFIVSDPRRNKSIASDGDKDDKIDAGKLASLLRGGFLRQIHHTDDEQRAVLKHWVCLYHDRVRDAVRNINKIRARCRMHGVKIPRIVIRNAEKRTQWLSDLENRPLADQLSMLWVGYDANVIQVNLSKRHLAMQVKKHPVVLLWRQLPGIALIRAVTFFAFIDTPWRFRKKNKLWKYCGVGLERTASGTDKKGKPKPARLRLPFRVNRYLKNAVIGAARSAINQKDNVFRDHYERMLKNGILPSNAVHGVARKMLDVIWAMWKTNNKFDENLCQNNGSAKPVSALKR